MSSTRNVIWNWAGTGVEVAAGFVLAPVLIHALGADVYGVWVIIGALTTYFGTLDLGIRGSVGRFVAFHAASASADQVNGVINSALAVLGGLSAAALVGTVGAAYLFPALLPSSPVPTGDARLAIFLIGFNVALSLCGNCFDASLWGVRRFDLLNAVDIPVTVGRTIASGLVAWLGFGVVGLAIVTLCFAAAGFVAKLVLLRRVVPYVRFGRAYASRSGGKQLVNYGAWNGARSVGVLVRRSLAPIAVGYWFGATSVTAFSLASRLVAYATLVMNATTGVLTPVAAGYESRGQSARLADLFFHGGELCTFASAYVVALIAILGPAFVALWVGPSLGYAGELAAVLAIGEFLPLSLLVAEGVLLGKARHQILAVVTIADAALGLALAFFVRDMGLLGLALAFSVSATIVRGVPLLLYALRVLGFGSREYLRRVLIPGLFRILLPVMLLVAVRYSVGVDTWPRLLLAIVLSGLTAATLAAVHPLVRPRLVSGR